MNALIPLSLVFCRCGRVSKELLIFGTSRFFIVPFGLDDLRMSWYDLLFGSPFTNVGMLIGVAVAGLISKAVVGSESTCGEESTCCCCMDAGVASGVGVGVVSGVGVGVGVVLGVGVEAVLGVGVEAVLGVGVEVVSGVGVAVVSGVGVAVVSGVEVELDVEIVVSEEASFFFEDCEFALFEFFA